MRSNILTCAPRTPGNHTNTAPTSHRRQDPSSNPRAGPMADEDTALLLRKGRKRESRVQRASRRVSQWFGIDEGEGDSDENVYRYQGYAMWYHGAMTSEAAERRLKIHGMDDGLFLIRERPALPGDFVLTMSCDGRVSLAAGSAEGTRREKRELG